MHNRKHHTSIRSRRYPYKAQAPTSLRPEKVDPQKYSHHYSYVTIPGIRFYMFASLAGRNLFVEDYKHMGAQSR